MRQNIGILTGGVLDAVFEAEGSEPWSSFPSLASVLTSERVHCVTSGATGMGGQNQSNRGSNANGTGPPIWIRFEFRMRGAKIVWLSYDPAKKSPPSPWWTPLQSSAGRREWMCTCNGRVGPTNCTNRHECRVATWDPSTRSSPRSPGGISRGSRVRFRPLAICSGGRASAGRLHPRRRLRGLRAKVFRREPRSRTRSCRIGT